MGVPIMTAIQPDLILAGQVLAILAPAAGIVFFGALYGHTIVALNKQKIMTLGYLAVAFAAIAGYVMYVPTYGAWAAAWVTLGSECLIAFLTFAVVTKTIGSLPTLGMLARALAASLVMTASILLIPTPHAFLTVLLGAVVYMISLTALG